MPELESLWNGKDALTDSLDRDYAAMRGDGWDLIWEPPSPLTTPWDNFLIFAQTDPNRYIASDLWHRSQRTKQYTQVFGSDTLSARAGFSIIDPKRVHPSGPRHAVRRRSPVDVARATWFQQQRNSRFREKLFATGKCITCKGNNILD